MRATSRTRLMLCLCAAGLVMGCAEDEKDPEITPAPVGSLDGFELSPDDYEVFRFSEVELPYKDSATCKTSGDQSWAIRSCGCDKCLERMQECDVLTGCQEIVSCSLKSGCQNEFSCYLIPLAPCTQVVDKWGNSSVATSVALEVMACAADNGCR